MVKKTYKKKMYRNNSGIKNYVKKMINKNIETKLVVATFTDVAITSTLLVPYTYAFNDISQGVGQQQRIGNLVRCTSMKYNLFITGADSTNSVRIIFYIPRDPTTVMAGLAFNQAPDIDQFTVLKDMFITTSNTGNNCIRKVGWLNFKRGKSTGMPVFYSSSTPASVTKNRILMYCVSDSGAPSHPTLNGYTRLFYKDA